MRARDDKDAAWVVLALFGLSRGRDVIQWGSGWVFPVPDMRDTREGPTQRAVVSQEFRAPSHMGIDVMYRDKAGAFYAPRNTPIVAAHDGVVWNVTRTARGWAIVIDHGAPFATFYQHLNSVTPGIVKGAEVTKGQRIGIMGIDPTDAAQIRHLHFAVWHKGHGDSASVDPGPELTRWGRVKWNLERTSS